MSDSTKASRHFVQVPMPDWMFDAFKDLADDLGIDRKKLLEDFISTYISTKKEYELEKNRHLILYASPANAKARSMWISPQHFAEVDTFAKTHETRANRVIFSATLQGLVDKHRVKI